ncbi:MAG: DUF2809 domain-containing protein [Planctomycetes bacterium]|nr:DUF2809 domain-containing protein [Planctomycetota bacterium]
MESQSIGTPPPRKTTGGICQRSARKGSLYFLSAIAVAAAGLASRRYRDRSPEFLAEYAGDPLWALMVFLLVSTLVAGASTWLRACIALLFSFLVEISQLYHAPWIDTIRATKLGGLVLGHGFLRSDFACYTAGVTISFLADQVIDWLVHAEKFTTSGQSR